MINLNHALIEKRLEWSRRNGKEIFLHDIEQAQPEKRQGEHCLPTSPTLQTWLHWIGLDDLIVSERAAFQNIQRNMKMD